MRQRANRGTIGGWARGRRLGVLLALAGAVGLGAGHAWDAQAQPRRKSQPAEQQAPGAPQNQPAAQPGRSASKPMKDSPYLKRYDPEEWTLKIRLDVASEQQVLASPTGLFPKADIWKFDSATVVFPVLPETAGFVPMEDEKEAFEGVLTFGDRVKQDTFEILPGYPSGTKLAKWTLSGGGFSGQRMNLEMRIRGTAYKVEFDEAAASRVPWPTAWPPEALEATKPEPYITHHANGEPYDMAPVRALVEKWTKGKPQSQPPVVTAKWITGQLVEMVQVSGSGFGYSRTGKIQGIEAMGAPEVALSGRGSQFDATCLLVACLREAGIPARMVIGYDIAADKEKQQFLKTRKVRSEDLRAWAEFALYDEKLDSLTWVPVDVVSLRKKSSRMPSFNKPWEFFGTNEELQSTVPFAFQLQPPTTVRSYGSPGFWGWLVLPAMPARAEQWLTLNAESTPNRGGRPRRN